MKAATAQTVSERVSLCSTAVQCARRGRHLVHRGFARTGTDGAVLVWQMRYCNTGLRHARSLRVLFNFYRCILSIILSYALFR